jgi:hypothetical protein
VKTDIVSESENGFSWRQSGYFGTKMIKLCGYAMKGLERSNNFFVKAEMGLRLGVWCLALGFF